MQQEQMSSARRPNASITRRVVPLSSVTVLDVKQMITKTPHFAKGDRDRDEMLTALGAAEPLRECRDTGAGGHRLATTRALPIHEVKSVDGNCEDLFCGDAPGGTMPPLGRMQAPRVFMPGDTRQGAVGGRVGECDERGGGANCKANGGIGSQLVLQCPTW